LPIACSHSEGRNWRCCDARGTNTNGIAKRDTLASARYGLTLSIPLAESVSVKLAWSTGLVTRGGADFETFGVVLQYRWFDR
jgi:hypothetical protein